MLGHAWSIFFLLRSLSKYGWWLGDYLGSGSHRRKYTLSQRRIDTSAKIWQDVASANYFSRGSHIVEFSAAGSVTSAKFGWIILTKFWVSYNFGKMTDYFNCLKHQGDGFYMWRFLFIYAVPPHQSLEPIPFPPYYPASRPQRRVKGPWKVCCMQKPSTQNDQKRLENFNVEF